MQGMAMDLNTKLSARMGVHLGLALMGGNKSKSCAKQYLQEGGRLCGRE